MIMTNYERDRYQALMGLEDAREAAPLSSLGSFLFGTF